MNGILLILATGEGVSSKRRQLDSASTVYYQQGPRQTTESYQFYSQPSTVTRITEETQVYQMPTQYQQQQNEITYSIHGTQSKLEPVSFLVSKPQEKTPYADDTRTGYYEESSSYSSSGPNFTKVNQSNSTILFLIVFI